MVEPPAVAKPFTIDVDKKLEEGQKVCNLSVIKGNLCETGFFFFCLFCIWVCVSPEEWLFHSESQLLFMLYIYLFVCGNVEATWVPCGFLGFNI